MQVVVTNLAETVATLGSPPRTYDGGAVDGDLAHGGSGGTRHPVHGVERLADVDVEVGVGVGVVVLLTLVVRLVAPRAVDERGQVDDGAAVPHGTFHLRKREKLAGRYGNVFC